MGRRPKRSRRPRRRRTRRRGGKRKSSVRTVIKEIVNTTVPLSFGYEFAYRPSSGTHGKAMFFMICQYNDAVDISAMHNEMWNNFRPTASFQQGPLQKLVVGEFKGKYIMKLANNLDTFIDVYKVVPRKDLDFQVSPVTNYSTTTVSYADIWDSLWRGLNEIYTGTTPLTAADFDKWPASMTPFNIPRFTTYFKIVKTKSFRITGAGYKMMNVNQKAMKLYNGEMIANCLPAGTNNPRPYTQMKGKTVSYFGIARCQPVTDATNVFAVSIGTPSILIAAQESYKYTAVDNAVARIPIIQTGYGTIGTARTMLAESELASGYVQL